MTAPTLGCVGSRAQGLVHLSAGEIIAANAEYMAPSGNILSQLSKY
jgi:hypothetical protein